MQQTQSAAVPIRLYLIDDHALFRAGLASVLDQRPDMKVAGTAETVTQAVAEVKRLQPDLILLDVDLGTERAIDFLYAARQASIETRVLVVTAGVSDMEAFALIREGVAGIFHKHCRPEDLCDAIRKVAGGDVYLEPRYLKGLFQNLDRANTASQQDLTDRERMVIRALLQGLANKEIGDRISLSESSVKAILRGLFDKLGVRTRSQLVKVALEQYSAQL